MHSTSAPTPPPAPHGGPLDALDRALVQALTLDGRASFARLAEVLEVSDQTVVRRYRRLRTTGLVRVVALPLGRRVGLFESWLRVQCAPDAALPVAEALARRPDIAWVTLNSGGTEIQCMTRARTRQERDTLLLEKLPRTRRVTGIAAHTILRKFFGGPEAWAGLDVLRPDQIAALERPPVEPGPERYALDETELALLSVLGQDGRAGYPELARATGLSESTARRRLERLREAGAVFFDVEIVPAHLGYEAEATLVLTVPPARLAEVGAAIGGHPEVPFAAAVTGAASLMAVVVCRDTDALYTYLTERIGAVPGIQQVELIPTLRTIKRAGMLVEDGRLVDPPPAP
ncbi:Lrp/AsnC family transcriptional regulator [Streptomyces antarcticus]|uniref:Lrp/AsnC family transcriptional regulator n=1 Tax=Streptomyces antarcticus TaxID=2996458 RepID=UPI00226D6616|nr:MULTISPECIES: Lrp/AsnC family transcriptional regulator [unclassified Streptomyces]MCY0940027.1 Lrp/AsnC family transcriptional regulator [Streptomyces sp. H34-AA3]MCY0948217.1 Lrp/AsnC family transcriptional regulator [Streptomyces sp. H27-S2]MCZ4083691.1 Lrp/AsnC family transcriptional regulator [Streptomyces sp. H34-S5]